MTTTPSNPLIQGNILDTLYMVENSLRFVNDYFYRLQYSEDEPPGDAKVWHGLQMTMDMSIEAIRHEIERDKGKTLRIMNILNEPENSQDTPE